MQNKTKHTNCSTNKVDVFLAKSKSKIKILPKKRNPHNIHFNIAHMF